MIVEYDFNVLSNSNCKDYIEDTVYFYIHMDIHISMFTMVMFCLFRVCQDSDIIERTWK